jgi:hypothetical protein
LLKLKVTQKIILGYSILSKNHNEPPKVAQLANNYPIWLPWIPGYCLPKLQEIVAPVATANMMVKNAVAKQCTKQKISHCIAI